MEQNNFQDYDELREQYEYGRISAVEFVTRQDEVMTRDYQDFCQRKDLDPGSESSALAFMEYREALFDENISN